MAEKVFVEKMWPQISYHASDLQHPAELLSPYKILVSKFLAHLVLSWWKHKCGKHLFSDNTPDGCRDVSLIPPLFRRTDVHAPQLPVETMARVLIALQVK